MRKIKYVLLGLILLLPVAIGAVCFNGIKQNSQTQKLNIHNEFFEESQYDDFIFADNSLKQIDLLADSVKYSVIFNSNGGTTIASQEVEMGGLIDEPETPQKLNKDLFVGWYYNDDGEDKLWNFNQDTVSGDIELYAKWAGLKCDNLELLNQTINSIKTVRFTIAISSNVIWYVNNIVQSASGGEFSFNAPVKAGAYAIKCVVDGVESKTYVVNINYYKPKEIKIVLNDYSDNNMYTFSIENGEYIDRSKCVWYMSLDEYSKEYKEIKSGQTICKVKIDKNCKVIAVYRGDEDVKSNTIDVTPKFILSSTLIIIISVVCCLVAVVVVFIVLSRKKYKVYY